MSDGDYRCNDQCDGGTLCMHGLCQLVTATTGAMTNVTVTLSVCTDCVSE